MNADVEHTCSICLEPVGPRELYVAPCDDRHVFHAGCIHRWGKLQIRNAVTIENGECQIAMSRLPACPMCRGDMCVVHRAQGVATFYLLSKKQCLMEVARVDERTAAPTLRINKESYYNRNSIAT